MPEETSVDEVIIEHEDDDNNSSPPDKDDSMATPNGSDKFHAIVEAEMGMVSQTGRIAQNNFVTISKAADYDYLEGKRIVSLEEAIGVREVASKSVPAGPNVPQA